MELETQAERKQDVSRLVQRSPCLFVGRAVGLLVDDAVPQTMNVRGHESLQEVADLLIRQAPEIDSIERSKGVRTQAFDSRLGLDNAS